MSDQRKAFERFAEAFDLDTANDGPHYISSETQVAYLGWLGRCSRRYGTATYTESPHLFFSAVCVSASVLLTIEHPGSDTLCKWTVSVLSAAVVAIGCWLWKARKEAQ